MNKNWFILRLPIFGHLFESDAALMRLILQFFFALSFLSLIDLDQAFSAQPSLPKLSKSKLSKRLKKRKMKPVVFPQPVETNEMKKEDYAKYVPSNLENSRNEAYVANRFGDVALKNFFESPEVRNSSFGRTATKVENAMKTEVNLSKAPEDPKPPFLADGGAQKIPPQKKISQKKTPQLPAPPPPVEHKISFQVLALQAQTKLEYKGWTHATLKHDTRAGETGLEIAENVLKNKELVVSHVKNNIEDKSSVGVRWSF